MTQLAINRAYIERNGGTLRRAAEYAVLRDTDNGLPKWSDQAAATVTHAQPNRVVVVVRDGERTETYTVRESETRLTLQQP